MKKIIVGNKIVFEQNTDGKVVIDKRIEAALEDGKLKRLTFYDLSKKAKEEVIDTLKKLNAVNKGLTTENAEKWSKIIRTKIGPPNYDNSPSQELDINGNILYKTDSKNNVIVDKRVSAAVDATLLSYALGDHSLDKLNNYDLSNTKKNIIKKHIEEYIKLHPLKTNEDKKNFLEGSTQLVNKINNDLVITKPKQISAITGKVVTPNNGHTEKKPTISKDEMLKNISAYTHAVADALQAGNNPDKTLQNMGLTKFQQADIMYYFNKYMKYHPLSNIKWKNHLTIILNHITANTKHRIEGHPDNISNDLVYLPPKKDYTKDLPKIKKAIKLASTKKTKEDQKKAIASTGLDEKAQAATLNQVKKYPKVKSINPDNTSVINGLADQTVYALNGDSKLYSSLTQNEFTPHMDSALNDTGWNFSYGLDINNSLNRHNLTTNEKNLIIKHLDKEQNKLKTENKPIGTTAGMNQFQKDFPPIKKAVVNELLKKTYKDKIDKEAIKKEFKDKLHLKEPIKSSPTNKNKNVDTIKQQEKKYNAKYGTPLQKKQKTINFKPSPKLVDKSIVSPKNMMFSLVPRSAYNIVHDDVPVKDSDWVTNVFMLNKNDLNPIVREAMFWTSAEMKLVDTSLGGNSTINNTPQFTRTADIRVMGLRTDRQPVKMETITGDHGMGRYYSEKIDDNTVKCFLSFGVPEFNGIFTFLMSAVNYESAVVANSGRNPLAYKAGHLVGSFAFFAAFPVISLVYWIGKEIKDLVVGPGNFEFYYMKGTMPKYWSIVNSLVMMMSTELGLILPTFNTESNSNRVGAPLKLSKEDMAYFHMFMPDAVTSEGYLNIMAVVTKTQRSINKYLKKQYKTIKTDSSIQHLQQLVKESQKMKPDVPTPYHDYWKEVKEKYDGPMYKKERKKKKKSPDKIPTSKTNANSDGTFKKAIADFKQNTGKYFENFKNAMVASMDGGAEYAILNVEYLGSSSMSVSNEVGELEIEGMLKGIGGKARAIRYSGAEGILGAVGDIAKYATDAAVGAIDGMTLNIPGKILTLLLGDANIALPKRWMDSSISLPTHSFKMKLISPYGNPMSQLINIYIPLASIMAGALPLATGMSSYTSPFLTSMFVRGYQNIPMGMITSLEITKGTSNLPFNQTWKPMAVDVTFTVTDFSQILALPVGQDMFSMANVIYDETNPLNRYIQALCGRDFYSTTFMVPKLKMRLSRIVDSVSVMVKPETLGMKMGDVLRPIGRMLPWHIELGDYTQR